MKNKVNKFADMNYRQLCEVRDVEETIKDCSKEGSQEWIRADLKIAAINEEINRRYY